MDTQDHVGSGFVSSQQFRNLDVLGRTLAQDGGGRIAHTFPQAFARLVKTLARGDEALEDQILRRWGIRRDDLETTLSLSAV